MVDIGGEVELWWFFCIFFKGNKTEKSFEEESADCVEEGLVGLLFGIVEVAVVGKTAGEGAGQTEGPWMVEPEDVVVVDAGTLEGIFIKTRQGFQDV